MQKYLNETVMLFLDPHGKHKSITVKYWVQELLNDSIFCDFIKISSKFPMSKNVS